VRFANATLTLRATTEDLDDLDDLDALRALAMAAWQQPTWSRIDGPEDVLTRLELTETQ
jgi:hypothetical protein